MFQLSIFPSKLTPDGFIQLTSIIFSVLCFFPMYDINYANMVDDYTSGFNSDNSILMASFASLIISILPGLDLLCDIFPSILLYDFKVSASENLPVSTAVRLNKIEKLLFLMGVISFSILIYPSFQRMNVTNPAFAAALFLAFENMSTILTICPIMSLLYRVSTTWNAYITISISFCVSLSSFLSSLVATYSSNYAISNDLFIVSNILISVASVIYLYACAMSAYQTYQWNKSLKSTVGRNPDSLARKELIYEQNFRNNVMASHMIATLIEMIVNNVWFWLYLNLTPYQISVFIYLVLASSIITFLIEFRVRKTEVTTALVALLDSKKSYVRYISHELRTPLNAATLGLKLVSDDLHRNPAVLASHTRASELVETLDDVQLACNTTVNILNDLLSFEKLESGILELHCENIPVVSFVTDCIKIFSGQAREKRILVNLEVDNIDNGDKQQGLVEVTTNDNVFADRFKLEQVLRNLVSNAIKFSIEGSAVTVKVSYKPPTMVHDQQKSFNLFTSKSSNEPRLPRFLSFDKYRILTSGENTVSSKSMVEFGGQIISQATNQIDYSSSKGQAKAQVQAQNTMNRGYNYSEEVLGNMVDVESQTPNNLSHKAQSSTVSTSSKSLTALLTNNSHGRPFNPNSSGYLVIQVVDSGVGISKENQSKLFRGVVQFSPEILQAGGGSGFGLFISKGIVELHKGQLIVLSEGEGHGSAFVMMIPMSRRPSTTDLAGLDSFENGATLNQNVEVIGLDSSRIISGDESTRRVNSRHVHLGSAGNEEVVLENKEALTVTVDIPSRCPNSTGMQTRAIFENATSMNATVSAMYRLLIVDDSKMNRKMLHKIMSAAGHVCQEAEDGSVAVEMVAAQLHSPGGLSYDAILMDFVMPHMDGPTATKILRDMKVTIPIFGVTGNGMKRDVDWFVQCGASAVLIKPFEISDFNREMSRFRVFM